LSAAYLGSGIYFTLNWNMCRQMREEAEKAASDTEAIKVEVEEAMTERNKSDD
jgi:hypothetical protein